MSRPGPTPGMSLSRRLLIGVLPAAVMFVVLMVFFTSARLHDARADLAQSSQLFADSLAPALEYAVVSGNRAALEQVLRQSLRRSKAQWLRVTDVTGAEIGFVSANGNGNDQHVKVYDAEILRDPVEMETMSEYFTGRWNFSAGSLRVGTLEVGVSETLLEARQKDILWSSLTVGVAMLLFTMLLVNHFLSAIFRAISRLSIRVDALIHGNYREQPTESHGGGREIVKIQKQLNELAHQLRQAAESRDQNLAISEAAREKAEHASQAKSEFLAGISQELRAPLQGVLGTIDRVQAETLSSQQRDDLKTARQATNDLLTVIADMLDYARMESGSFEFNHQEFDLRSLISNCVASYRLIAEQQGLMLDLHLQGHWREPPLVIGDAFRIRQVLAGVLSNSLQFTSDGYITVRASMISLDDDHVMLSCTVSDSGSGAAAQRLESAFADGTTVLAGAPVRSGIQHGLGLPMVQKLVELMGGNVQVNADFGQGAYFRFDLPLQLPPEP